VCAPTKGADDRQTIIVDSPARPTARHTRDTRPRAILSCNQFPSPGPVRPSKAPTPPVARVNTPTSVPPPGELTSWASHAKPARHFATACLTRKALVSDETRWPSASRGTASPRHAGRWNAEASCLDRGVPGEPSHGSTVNRPWWTRSDPSVVSSGCLGPTRR
jgi:hypothetical protein